MMALRRDWIPENILSAAKRAGLKMPDWYVGRNNGHGLHERKATLASIAETVKRKIETDEQRKSPPET
jgi:aminoglycoside/choline kinase family phosphotransferase